MSYHFFAMMSRMKYIRRWGLMRNTEEENLSEHCLEVAMLAHALCMIRNERLGGSLDCDRAAVLGMYHDATEIITGDLPTPIKYFDENLRSAYAKAEESAQKKLVDMLPDYLKGEFASFIIPDDEDAELWKIVKAADKLSALIKCMNECALGNRDFEKARLSTEKTVDGLDMPEVRIFMEEFMPSFGLTIDEQA